MPETTNLSLPVLPLRNGVVFPHMVVTLLVESDEGVAAVAAAREADQRLLLVPRLDDRGDDRRNDRRIDRRNDRYASVGTIAEIQAMDDGSGVVVRGLARAKVGAGRSGDDGALWVDVEPIPDLEFTDDALDELVANYRAVVSEVLELKGMAPIADRILGIEHPGQLADLAVYSPDLSLEQKIEVLETTDVHERLGKLIEWMNEVLGELALRQKVRRDASERMEKSQREYVLRQQLDAIRAELGDEDDAVSEYRSKLEATELPEKVHEAVVREVDRLERMNQQSPEHSWIRTWLDTVFELPWGERSEDHLDLTASREVLDADHTGLDDVKERIVEHLAVRKLRTERDIDHKAEPGARNTGAILLLVGPPGVGKTSLGESVARALGRSFVRVALGGVRDEAEIRGHRRTYVGSRPGRIARALSEAGTMNPVFLLDEMDKVGNDWRGDPSSALLEVLDPAQNHTFRDHYLEFDLDLSDVLFIATANVVDTIPAPLLDRTEVIRIDGYTDNEKVAIAREHLLRKQIAAAGLETSEIEISDEALAAIVDGYTREPGVRTLERQLGKLVRKVATKVATEGESHVVVDANVVRELLGKPSVHHDEVSDRVDAPGVATGLAVTGAGGDILFVEATTMDGETGLTITGQLGDVMNESAQIALSYVRANAERYGIDPALFDKRLHVHFPAGAIPKDGPSAGVTITTALVSLLTDRKVKATLGMTGEVTLHGNVLPVGGIKQKVLAAHRGGLTEVIIPARNEADLDDVPDEVRESLTFHVLSDVGDVLKLAFTA